MAMIDKAPAQNQQILKNALSKVDSKILHNDDAEDIIGILIEKGIEIGNLKW